VVKHGSPLAGVFLIPLGLPLGLPMAVTGLCMWFCAFWAIPLLVRARYGAYGGPEQFAPVPLSWDALWQAASSEPLRLEPLAGMLLLPPLVTLAAGALLRHCRPPRRATAAVAGKSATFSDKHKQTENGGGVGASGSSRTGAASSRWEPVGVPQGGQCTASADEQPHTLPESGARHSPEEPSATHSGGSSRGTQAAPAPVPPTAPEQAGLTARAAPPRRRVRPYVSPFAGQRALLIVKAEAPGGHTPAGQAMLAATVPPAVRQALQVVGTQLPSGAPLVLSAVGFPG
jgi:hypothetical protein